MSAFFAFFFFCHLAPTPSDLLKYIQWLNPTGSPSAASQKCREPLPLPLFPLTTTQYPLICSTETLWRSKMAQLQMPDFGLLIKQRMAWKRILDCLARHACEWGKSEGATSWISKAVHFIWVRSIVSLATCYRKLSKELWGPNGQKRHRSTCFINWFMQ